MNYWFIFQNEKILILSNKHLPSENDIYTLKDKLAYKHFIGQFHQVNCYCAELSTGTELDTSFTFISLKKAFELYGHDWYVPCVKAYSIINWDKNHQFCGRCGNPTVHHTNRFERLCTACHLPVYPRISPSMIVLIKKDDMVLMARSPHFVKGVYGLIAGFLEAGESAEDAVHREVKEEVGIKVKNVKYFGSQAWPFPDSLMLGFTADYDSGDLVIDYTELETAGWYTYDQLPGRPSTNISLGSQLLDHFIAEQKEKKHGTS